MKRKIAFAVIITLIISMAAMTACVKSEFGLTENTEKAMTLEAKNAAADDFFMVGSLVIAEGEQISVKGNLEKGSVKLEFIAEAEEQSIDELPDMDGEATFTANIEGTDMQAGTVPAGDYMLRATVLEKATGTIQIDAEPAS